MKPTPIHYFIFIRPPGSWTWTMHTFASGSPWRDGSAEIANKVAQSIAEHSKYCAIVKGIELTQEQDSEQYALFADGDTIYKPMEPHISKRTK